MCVAENGNSARCLSEAVERLQGLVGQERVSEDYVRFRIAVLKAQWAVREALAADFPARPSPAEATAQRDGPDGKPPGPALEPNAVPIDGSLLSRLYGALCEAAGRPGCENAAALRLTAAAGREPGLLAELARKAAFGPDQAYLESLARRLEVPPDALLFFGRTLAAPFVAAAARRVRPDAGPGATDGSGHCAICGSPPAMAKLRRDDGRRILYCSLCGASWEFTRLACPYCGSRDRDALTFLRVTESDPRWIEACERCKGYIKTVDERRLPVGEQIIPVVEEAATLHLDLLAEREGYARRLPYAAAR